MKGKVLSASYGRADGEKHVDLLVRVPVGDRPKPAEGEEAVKGPHPMFDEIEALKGKTIEFERKAPKKAKETEA